MDKTMKVKKNYFNITKYLSSKKKLHFKTYLAIY